MAAVDVQFSALPAHVGTARLVASAVARRSGLAEGVLDEVRTAVGEACARAVDLHQRFAPSEAVRMEISDDRGRLGITVIDAAIDRSASELDADGIGIGRYDPESIAETGDLTAHDKALDFLPEGFGVAVIRALVDDVEVTTLAVGGGTRIRMSWPIDDGS